MRYLYHCLLWHFPLHPIPAADLQLAKIGHSARLTKLWRPQGRKGILMWQQCAWDSQTHHQSPFLPPAARTESATWVLARPQLSLEDLYHTLKSLVWLGWEGEN
jgi:hypothetical protein